MMVYMMESLARTQELLVKLGSSKSSLTAHCHETVTRGRCLLSSNKVVTIANRRRKITIRLRERVCVYVCMYVYYNSGVRRYRYLTDEGLRVECQHHDIQGGGQSSSTVSYRSDL